MQLLVKLCNLESVQLTESSVKKDDDIGRYWIRDVLNNWITVLVDQLKKVTAFRIDLDSVSLEHGNHVFARL